MAKFGLSKPTFAKLDVATGTYSDGFVCGAAVNTSINPSYAEGSLYGDNAEQEHVKVFKSADVNVGTTDMPVKAKEVIFGHKTDSNKETAASKDSFGSYVGYGFISTEINNGVISYVGCVLPKVLFAESEESYETRGENIVFTTPSINGTASVDKSGNWKYTKSAETEDEAQQWINSKLNITK